MVRTLKRSWTAVLFGLLIGPGASGVAAERPAEAILKDLNAVRFPPVDQSRLAEPGYRASVEQTMKEAASLRDALIRELFHADPNHESLPPLMQERWRRLPPIGANEAKLNQEIAEVLARSQNDQLKTEAYFARAQAGLFKSRQTGTLDLSGVEEFLKKAPKDQRAPLLLYMGTFVTTDEKAKASLENRLLKDYPDSQVTNAIRAARRQREGLGKPFELEFTDTISGAKISMQALKGKVVVVDFWATWCPPCVAAMPHMKELYAKYHGQGVEFIGVSLDNDGPEGLESVKKFVEQNDIRWPQFYQGKPGAREFAQSWGIEVIPTVFVVNTEGKLHSLQAGDQLDTMIPELLGKKAGAPKTPAGRG
jgi:thiol-disulfide isomerase/thioredoxin